MFHSWVGLEAMKIAQCEYPVFAWSASDTAGKFQLSPLWKDQECSTFCDGP